LTPLRVADAVSLVDADAHIDPVLQIVPLDNRHLRFEMWLNRGDNFPQIRFWGSPATKITSHLLWDVTGSSTCVVMFVEKPYFWGIGLVDADAHINPVLQIVPLDNRHLRFGCTVFISHSGFRKSIPPQNRQLIVYY